MKKRTRFIIVCAVLAVGFIFLSPTWQWFFTISDEEKSIAISSKERIREQVELRSGEIVNKLEELYRNDNDAAVPDEYGYLINLAVATYQDKGAQTPDVIDIAALFSAFPSREKAQTAIAAILRADIQAVKDIQNSSINLGLDLSGGMSILLQADTQPLAEKLQRQPDAQEKEAAMLQVTEILNNRIDQFGVTEPVIRRFGTDQISIDIPGAPDPDRVDSFLAGKGSLAFHIMDEDATNIWNEYKKNNIGRELIDDQGQPLEAGVLEAGKLVLGQFFKDDYNIDVYSRDLVVEQEVGLDGSHIESATVTQDPVSGETLVILSLDSEGGDKFYSLTSSNINKPLAVVLDGKVKGGVPKISEAIRDQVRISGFDRQEAENLALVLRTAALPIALEKNSVQEVGASLGRQSVDIALNALAFGFLLVIAFMLVYYLGAGLVADLALLLNLFFTLAILSAFNLTLTLASIAGIILTVGMAVDANVIIFERIKEELRLGKSAQAAVAAGFSKAFWTIMDSNITTFIAAVFLSQLATGPVRGFAYTLAVGIVCSLFTSLFVSRLIFDFSTQSLKMKKVIISWRKL